MAGSGKGNLLAYDVFNGKGLWGFGVGKKGAVRNLVRNREGTRVGCAGEDEQATVLKF